MIQLSDIIHIHEPVQYKLHLACRNENMVNPLDDYVSDHKNWLGWNEWKGNRDDWTRDFVFSLMEFYPRSDSWLFGGVFRVIERHEDRYVLEEIEDYRKYVGRLILSFHRYQGMRGRAYYLENYINDFEVVEILPEPYNGESFPGFERISYDFHMLEPIFRSERADWKAALSSIKGIYVISDKYNGKLYVGSAYGDMGIWSRWSCYIGTGHGWNDDLMNLINEKSITYARDNFRLSLVETMSMSVADKTVLERELYWKNLLVSKEHGYNKN